MTLQQIKYILGVAEVGSFNKASEKLFISLPSLTKKESLSLEDLKDYHFVTFDTDEVNSFFSEEVIKKIQS